MKKFKGFLLILLLATVLLEVVLRMGFGFCDTVLVKEDEGFEYIAVPDQHRKRFGNHIDYNSLSMRSPEIDKKAKIILGFGDSVLNGGVLTDQDDLASNLISDSLSVLRNEKVEFLNISAGSWGPDNCYAYLEKHGDFRAQKIYLIVSSHDAYDSMDFKPIVGLHKSFPNAQYKLAIIEMVDRYILPRLGFKENDSELGISKRNANSNFNSGFQSFLTYSKKHNIPLVIYLHADLNELKDNTYNQEGQEIIQFAMENNIPLIQDLKEGLNKNAFRDSIHYNDAGQELMASIILNHEGKL